MKLIAVSHASCHQAAGIHKLPADGGLTPPAALVLMTSMSGTVPYACLWKVQNLSVLSEDSRRSMPMVSKP